MGPHPTRDLFITTASGRRWHLMDPSPAEVDLRDIASHLAKLCRFVGACQVPYSVAQHSVLVAEQLPPAMRGYGLLHDGHEAYLGDISAPLKRAIGLLAGGPHLLGTFTATHDAAIHAAAGLPWPPPREVLDAVHEADLRAFATEMRDLMPPHSLPLPCRPMGTRIRPLPWAKAEEAFLKAAARYIPSFARSVP